MKNIFLFLFICVSFIQAQSFDSIFVKYPESGIVIYDLKNNKTYTHNPKHCKKRFIPASTFKIPNSLIGLETKIIPDTSFIIKWDGTKYDFDFWNRDHSLKSAFAHSVVWYYIELAKRVGADTIQKYVDMFNYGNKKANGGKRAFWLDGNIRISVNEQIEFLKKLYFNKLPVSAKTQNLVKDIMINDKTSEYTLRGKTGTGIINGKYYCWFVGYLEQNNNVYFFAMNINSRDSKNVVNDRITLAKRSLKALGLL